MEVTITARHCEIPASLRERAEARVRALARYEPRATVGDVIFDLDHGVSRAEVKLLIPGTATVAHGSGGSFREALDAAVDRLSRQLKRRNEQRIDRRRAGMVVRELETESQS